MTFFKRTPILLYLLIALGGFWGTVWPAETRPVSKLKVEVSLITDRAAIAPGDTFWLGIRYRMDPHWHVYWMNYGNTGIPTEIEWLLPEGFEVEALQWPTPSTFRMGGLMSYVYEDEVILMARVTAPKDLDPGQPVSLGAKSWWLVCDDETCIPGKASLTLEIPVNETAEVDASALALLEKQQAQWPRESEHWSVRGEHREGLITLLIEPRGESVPELQDLYFFSENSAIDPDEEQPVDAFEDGSYRMVLEVSDSFTGDLAPLPGVLKSSSGWEVDSTYQGLQVAPLAGVNPEEPLLAVETGTGEAPPASASGVARSNLWQAGLFAFLGGIILNLMPCVFPVLGLKIMGFVKQAGEDSARIRKHGLIFALGVFVSLWLLVAALLSLRAAGSFIGWGFQLQDPRFVAFIVILFFAFGLNLLGVFELGNSLVGTGSKLTRKEGMSGSFFSGVLAVIVATPCTAPFMGVAIGYALAAPVWLTFLIFTLLGAGLVTPYLLLSFFPAGVRKLPRPGPWMESFKQFMAFPLLATALYFLWVYGAQLGLEALVNLLVGLLALGFALWIYGRWGGLHRSRAVRFSALSLAVLCGLAGLTYGLQNTFAPPDETTLEQVASTSESPSAQTFREHGVDWQAWSPEIVETLRREGKTVYVDFTAAWCLTCQANKKAVFSSAKVRDRFNEQEELVLLKADWTRKDPRISRALESFNRSGVPLNVIYAGEVEPIILPAALTPGIVMDALDRAGAPQ